MLDKVYFNLYKLHNFVLLLIKLYITIFFNIIISKKLIINLYSKNKFVNTF